MILLALWKKYVIPFCTVKQTCDSFWHWNRCVIPFYTVSRHVISFDTERDKLFLLILWNRPGPFHTFKQTCCDPFDTEQVCDSFWHRGTDVIPFDTETDAWSILISWNRLVGVIDVQGWHEWLVAPSTVGWSCVHRQPELLLLVCADNLWVVTVGDCRQPVSCYSWYVQTDADESLCGIKDQYFNAVQKIKGQSKLVYYIASFIS